MTKQGKPFFLQALILLVAIIFVLSSQFIIENGRSMHKMPQCNKVDYNYN